MCMNFGYQLQETYLAQLSDIPQSCGWASSSSSWTGRREFCMMINAPSTPDTYVDWHACILGQSTKWHWSFDCRCLSNQTSTRNQVHLKSLVKFLRFVAPPRTMKNRAFTHFITFGNLQRTLVEDYIDLSPAASSIPNCQVNSLLKLVMIKD